VFTYVESDEKVKDIKEVFDLKLTGIANRQFEIAAKMIVEHDLSIAAFVDVIAR